MPDKVLQFRPRPLHETPPPLGLFLRPGYNHHQDLADALAAGHTALTGVVFEAALADRQQALRESIRARRLDAVLDPQTQQLATPGGHNERLGKLPWALDRPHVIDDLLGDGRQQFVYEIAKHVAERGYTAALAPTHLLSGADDRWLQVDLELCCLLRQYLDHIGHRRVDIYYSLALPMSAFREPETRRALIEALRPLPIDGLWLKVSGFGGNATASSLRAYVEGAREFQRLDLPLVAEKVGGLVGLALLALGAAGGVEHGVTVGERFEARAWSMKRPRGGGNAQRVYIPTLDLFLTPNEAQTLFEAHGAKARFGCRDTSICPQGVADMLRRPGRYFAVQRMAQVAQLSQIPPSLRASEFVERQVRPLTDQAVFASGLPLENNALQMKLQKNRARLDRLRPVLGSIAAGVADTRIAVAPPTRARRGAHPAPETPRQ